MLLYSCPMIINQYLNFNGRIDTGDEVLTLCCESLPRKNAWRPGVSMAGEPVEVLERFLGMRNMVITSSLKEGDRAKTITKDSWLGCKHCANYQKGDWQPQLQINYVNLSMYPAPCQCKCSYCGVYRKWEDTQTVKDAYEKLFAVLDMANERGIISANASWQISTGEITIHPYRKRIYELTKGKSAVFYTNGFIYDENIGRNLAENPSSAINVSIDAGTPETWAAVKGADNFEDVCMNLAEYRKNALQPRQISLKYIILPGINDSEQDYLSLMDIMDALETPHLTISRDVREKYTGNNKGHAKLINAASRLAAHRRQKGITVDMFTYQPQEREAITARAAQL